MKLTYDDWVVDPRASVVRLYRNDGTRFAGPIELSASSEDVLQTELLPGPEIRLERVFRER